MSYSSRSSRQAKHCVLLSFAFFPRAQGERDSQTPNQNLANFSPVIFVVENTFTSLAKALKCFQIVLGNTERVTSPPCLHTHDLTQTHLSTNDIARTILDYKYIKFSLASGR